MRLTLVMLLLCLATGASHAQTPKGEPPSKPATSTTKVPAEPRSTSAAYGDWVLVCQRGEAAQAHRLCEVSHSVQIQGQQGPSMQLAISRAKQPAQTRLTVVLPSNVTLTTTAKLSIEEADKQPLQLSWLLSLIHI